MPLLTNLLKHQGDSKGKPCSPRVLIIAPTRELAMQIQETLGKASSAGLESVCVYGGVPKDEQRRLLRKASVVVATPGRLADLCDEGPKTCDLSSVEYLVLDEADRMLDFGFEPAVRAIISQCKPKPERQTVMFSATWPESVRKLAADFMADNTVRVTIGSPDLSASGNVKQIVEVIHDQRDKENRLIELLGKYHKSRKNRVLVFALYKKEAARIEAMLQRKGFKVQAIHGDKNQPQRTEALAAFKSGSHPLLVATDVAARGLDIPNVEYVINFTFPLTVEDYVHRIGRTGRGGNKGISHTLFTPHDKAHSGALINVLKQAKQEVPDALLKFGGTVKKKDNSNYGAFYKEVDMNVKGTKIVFD
jgi:ATP-dependent RNA helicase DBP3